MRAIFMIVTGKKTIINNFPCLAHHNNMQAIFMIVVIE